jgi:hypothetical protein
MNRSFLGTVASAGIVIASLLVATAPALAGSSSTVTGSIALGSATAATVQSGGTSAVAYGGSAWFATSVSGKMASRSYVYVNVVCLQNGKVVYQASNLDVNAAFTLADQPGDALVWNGGAANCIGSLVYRIDYQKSSSISYLDKVNFDVVAAS